MHSYRASRIDFLDWMRGLAAVIMLQGHTFDSFLRADQRNSAFFIFSQFFGGEAAAIFLFLTGVTFALGMNRREQLSPWQRVTAALKRARYLFLLAIVFRVQTWAFSWPHSHWTDLLRVDILNTMGATAAILAVLALRSGIDRVKLAAAAGAAIAALSPLISQYGLPALPPPIRAYFVPSYEFFSIFPWGAFLAFGVAVGSMIPLIERNEWSRVMQWSALVGFGLVFGGQYFSNLPFSIYAKSEFWLNSPALVACKLGITMLLGSAAFLWTEYWSIGWSWFRQLGTTSLVVYWVHIELVYGRWFDAFKGHLSVGACIAISAALITAMVGLSIAVTRLPWRRVWHLLRPGPVPVEPLRSPRGFRPPERGPEPTASISEPWTIRQKRLG